MDHPHGLTPTWTAADIAADLVTLRRVLDRYEALSWSYRALHPGWMQEQLLGMTKYAFSAVEVLAEKHEVSP